MINANPVYNSYFADPFVWRAEECYYAVGTGGAAASYEQPGPSVFQLLRSHDLANWTYISQALVPPDASLGDSFWAPEVAEEGGVFYMYYSVGFGDKKHRLRVAVSDRPEGPYEDQGLDLIDTERVPFAIDASPFRDDDGAWYLYYATDLLDDTSGRPGTALVVDRLLDMTHLAGCPVVVLRASHDWQRFQKDRPMYKGVYDWHTLEGPFALRRNGRVWVLYSGGRWDSDNYGVDFCWAESPLGPYVSAGAEEGARVLRTIPGRILGPGHNSVVTGPDKRDWIVYHAWDPQMTARTMRIDPLTWTPEGPACEGPTLGPIR